MSFPVHTSSKDLGVVLRGERDMQENEERWKELCALAILEKDPSKLVALTKEINRLLELKEQRLNKQRVESGNAASAE